MRTLVLLPLVGCLVVAGCGDGPTAKGKPKGQTPAAKASGLTVTSTAFDAGKPIPKKHARKGDNVSPPLAWSGAPEATKEFALICDDPDAPDPERPASKPWVHWVVYKIPAAATSLPEGRAGGVQGKNGWGVARYDGPQPPIGVHRYVFKLYALDAPLALEPGATKAQLLAAMAGHVLAQGELIGTYASER